MKMVPGLTRYAVRHEVSIGALHNTINEKDILEMMDLEGAHSGTVRRSWTHLQAHTLLLIVSGVYESKGEATASLWTADTGRAVCPY